MNIFGKSLIFTDLHIGLKSDSILRMNIIKKVIDEIISIVHREDIKNIFFLGDLFHSRAFLNVNTINSAIEIVQDLAQSVDNLFLIVGNHDIYYKTKTDVNSLKIFDSIKNVHIIQTSQALTLNDCQLLLVPWMGDLSEFQNSFYDIVLGHFDIPSNYLIKSYIEDNKSKTLSTNNVIIDLIAQDGLFVNSADVKTVLDSSKDSSDYLGDFIDKAKPQGLIFSGHIHTPKTFTTRGNRTFHFVGAPYEQTIGDIGHECGIFILNDDGSTEKRILKGLPKHFIIKNSEILQKDFDSYFNLYKTNISGNIVKRIIDEEGPKGFNQKVQDAIAQLNPYEELQPEYNIKPKYLEFDDSNTDSTKNLAENIKTSKIDYIVEYINQLNDDELKTQNINKNKLLDIFKTYIQNLSNISEKYEINI